MLGTWPKVVSIVHKYSTENKKSKLEKEDIVRIAIQAGEFSEHGLPQNLPFLMRFSELVIQEATKKGEKIK